MGVTAAPPPWVSQVDRVGDWQEVVSSVFGGLVVHDAGGIDGFHAHLRLGDLRLLRTATIEAARQRVTRRRGGERNGPADELVLMLQCTGTCEIEQGGHRSVLRAGDLVLFDNARPYELAMNDRFEQKLVRIERTLWGPLVPQLERRCAQRLGRSPVGRVLGSLVGSITTEASECASELDSLAPAVIDLAASAFLGQAKQIRRADATYTRVVQAIHRRIWDSALDPASLAREHRISLRYLHTLFHEHGQTVMGFVREARLIGCARVLQSSDRRRELGRLAERFGFDDDATFRRAFKRRFGLTPSAYARQAIAHPSDSPPSSAFRDSMPE